MKRLLYIGLSMFLGFLLTTLLHALVEFPLLAAIVGQWNRGETGYMATHWSTLHLLGSVLLAGVGLVGGFFFGRHWWQVLYVEKRYGTPRW